MTFVDLRRRNFLTLLDFTSNEINYLIDLAAQLKTEKRTGQERQRLIGKNIVLIFEKASTRTRCAFEVAAFDQGARVSYLGPTGSQMGQKESMRDTARVLARMYDGIEYRGFDQKSAEELARHGVPVWNGLTNEYHPTQVLADLLTIKEYSHKPLDTTSLCYIGNAHSNMGDSLMIGASKTGMDFRIAAPRELQPANDLIQRCHSMAEHTGARLNITDEIAAAVRGVDFIYTDVWVSMGELDSVWESRIQLLRPYQVTQQVMHMSANPEVKFMHCLPACHNRDTQIGEKIYQKYTLDAMEVTEEVFESNASIVFDQAENRLHTIKAVMVATLGN